LEERNHVTSIKRKTHQGGVGSLFKCDLSMEAAEAILLSNGYLKENGSRNNVFFEKESEVQQRYADI
jgi:hypothetical protein